MTPPTVRACPECDAADVIRRIRLGGYRCNACGHVMDEPIIRESRQEPTQRVGGLSSIGRAALDWNEDEEASHAD